MTLKKKLVNSSKELTSIYSVTALGMLLAVRIILGIFANASMPMFGNMLKISFNFLPIALAGAMFGPLGAGIVGAAGDVLSILIYNPSGSPIFPGFTLNGFITGVIFGLFLYKNNTNFKTVIPAWLTNTVLVEIIMSGYWLYFMYGMNNNDSFLVYLGIRAVGEAVKAVPTVFLIYIFGKAVSRIPIPQKR